MVPEGVCYLTNESSERFDKIAANYATSEVHSMSPTIRLLHQLVNLEAGASVCDMACGAGHLALSFATRAGRLVGVDPAPGMLDAFRRLAAQRGIEVETVEAYAESIPLRGDQFDLVVSRLAPHHFDDVDRAVAEMVRLTKIGGRVAIIDLEGHEDADIDEFNHKLEVLHDPTHIRSYTAARWKSMFENSGLKVEVLKNGLSERPQGTTVGRWCEIGSSGAESEAEIRASLQRAPDSFLEALNIKRLGGEFLLPIRTLLVVGTRDAAHR
ncbi:MAG: methyltransferase domain-containing protein [Acidobacteriota bacterium]|nr:methyltransferase domain-containing protein [Acidobacteriota bacterium]